MFLPNWLIAYDGILHAEGIPLTRIAEDFGTPCYLYSSARIRENLKRFREAFAGIPVELHYAVKANPLGAILRLLAREGLGAEVVSGGELLRAMWAGFPPEKIIFTGVGKAVWELELALEKGIRAVVVESLEELRTIEGMARERGRSAPVALRLNPGLSPETHPHLATAREGTKFGLDPPGAERALESIRRSETLRLVGFHLHLGSQILDPEPYAAAWEYLLGMYRGAREAGLSPEFLDLGGGFGIPYAPEERRFPLGELAEVIRGRIPKGVTVMFEPGRSLVGDAGILLTRVLYIKEVHGKRYVVVDAGMNDLLRPALYGARHRIVPVVNRPGPEREADIVGPICENADVLVREAVVPPLEPGDILAVLDVGAYGSSMFSQYNSRPRPAEVLLHRGKAYPVRERETIEDLIRGEIIPEFLR